MSATDSTAAETGYALEVRLAEVEAERDELVRRERDRDARAAARLARAVETAERHLRTQVASANDKITELQLEVHLSALATREAEDRRELCREFDAELLTTFVEAASQISVADAVQNATKPLRARVTALNFQLRVTKAVESRNQMKRIAATKQRITELEEQLADAQQQQQQQCLVAEQPPWAEVMVLFRDRCELVEAAARALSAEVVVGFTNQFDVLRQRAAAVVAAIERSDGVGAMHDVSVLLNGLCPRTTVVDWASSLTDAATQGVRGEVAALREQLVQLQHREVRRTTAHETACAAWAHDREILNTEIAELEERNNLHATAAGDIVAAATTFCARNARCASAATRGGSVSAAKLDELATDLRDLEESHSRVLEDCERRAASCEALSLTVDQLRSENAKLQASHDAMSTVRVANTELTQEIQDLTRRLEHATRETSLARDAVSTLRAERRGDQSEIAALRDQLLHQQNSQRDAELKWREHEAKLALSHAGELRRRESDADDAIERCRHFEAEVAGLRAQLAAEQQALRRSAADAEATSAEQTRQIVALSHDVDTAREHAHQLEKRASTAQAASYGLLTASEDLSRCHIESLAVEHRRVLHAQLQLAMCEYSCSQLQNRSSRAEIANEDIRRRLASATEELARSSRTAAEAAAAADRRRAVTLATANDDRVRHATVVAELECKAQRLEIMCDERISALTMEQRLREDVLQAETSALQQRVTALQDEATDLRLTCHRLADDVDRARDELRATQLAAGCRAAQRHNIALELSEAHTRHEIMASEHDERLVLCRGAAKSILNSALSSAHMCRDQMRVLQRQVLQSEDQRNASAAVADKALRARDRRIADLEDAQRTSADELDSVRATLRQERLANAELLRASHDAEDYAAELAALRNQQEALKCDLSAATLSLREALAQHAAEAAAKHHLQNRIEELEAAAQSNVTSNAALRRRLGTMEAEMEDAIKRLHASEGSCVEKDAQLAMCRTERRATDEDVTRLHADLRDAEALNLDLVSRVSELENALDDRSQPRSFADTPRLPPLVISLASPQTTAPCDTGAIEKLVAIEHSMRDLLSETRDACYIAFRRLRFAAAPQRSRPSWAAEPAARGATDHSEVVLSHLLAEAQCRRVIESEAAFDFATTFANTAAVTLVRSSAERQRAELRAQRAEAQARRTNEAREQAENTAAGLRRDIEELRGATNRMVGEAEMNNANELHELRETSNRLRAQLLGVASLRDLSADESRARGALTSTCADFFVVARFAEFALKVALWRDQAAMQQHRETHDSRLWRHRCELIVDMERASLEQAHNQYARRDRGVACSPAALASLQELERHQRRLVQDVFCDALYVAWRSMK